jgi:hypothetical protein
MMDRGAVTIAAAACSVVLLLIYAITMASTLTWAHNGADGGDLVTAVARGTIPHPPGFPTYLLLGELFIRFPGQTPAWRLNLMSAVLAAAAAGLTVIASYRLLNRTEKRDAAVLCSACTGLTLGLSPLFWSQALITEVYAPAAFFVALVTVLALSRSPVWVLGLVWGVGIGGHTTLLFLAPLVAWRAFDDDADGLQNRLRRLAALGFTALLSWGVLYGPVLLARGTAPFPWGDVSTPAGWWALVSGKLYRGYLFALPLEAWPMRLLAWAGLLARQFTPVGAVLAGLGVGHLWRTHRSLTLASAAAFGTFSLYAIGYNTTDSLVYLTLALPLAALWLATGLLKLADWITRRAAQGAWAILVLPLLLPLFFWKQMDVSGETDAMAWVDQVLEDAPQQAVLLTTRDAHTFTLWYAHDVLGQRPDVVVVDRDLWGLASYRKMVTQSLGLESSESELSPEEAAQRAGRPLIGVAQLAPEEAP